jgi:hypothetical protein
MSDHQTGDLKRPLPLPSPPNSVSDQTDLPQPSPPKRPNLGTLSANILRFNQDVQNEVDRYSRSRNRPLADRPEMTIVATLVAFSAIHGPLDAPYLADVIGDNALNSFVASLIKTRQYADLLDMGAFCSSSLKR